MTLKLFAAAAVAVAVAITGTAWTTPSAHADHVCEIITKFDRDKDGKMNIFEAKRAGKSLWTKLNPDNDFTLEYDEVDRRLSPEAFKAANKIGRKGLDRIEWTRLVKQRFRAANPDKDRTIECDELMTHAGRDLLAVTFH
ncbi:MAG: hypothetical protein AAFV45_11060 [Pseudomonadota bacterium]